MKHIKFFIASILLIATGNLLATVDPQPGQTVWTILSNIGLVSDCSTPIAISDPEGGTYTISAPGNYQLIENGTGQIIVDASDVCLNLNCFGLTHTDANEHVVSVNSDKKNIRIHHGKIGNTAPGNGCGILVNNGCSLVQVDNVRISDCGNGIRLDGQDGSEVANCKILACDFVGNTTGFVMNHTNRTIVKNCCCLDGLQAGYELLNSQVNCVTECKAINTTSADSTAVAFTSKNGRSNMFKDCAAKKTETDAWEFCNKAYGFLLTGTEEKTKIIDCIVNETDVTSTVSAVSYGIHLDPILLKGDELLVKVDDNDTSGSIPVEVAWSPNGKYIAIGDVSRQVRVFRFDGSTLTQIANNSVPTDIVNFVAWSPDGNYIASGDSGDALRVFSFDGATLTQIDFDFTPGGNVNSVAWSPNGKYIATGENGGFVRVFRFDGSDLTQIDFDSAPTGNATSVTWSPDGNYFAAGDTGNNLHVFRFDGSTITHVDDDPASGNPISSVAWSPIGTYIATGDNGSSVQIFSFDGLALTHIFDQTTPPGGVVNSVFWSPNGKYIVSGDIDNDVNVFSFDGTTLTYIKGVTLSDDANAVAWSPDGKYIASVDSDNFVSVFTAMFGPENCLIKNNCVCDTAAFGQFVGTGIAGSVANNGIIFNACHNNEVNYNYGIPNTYDLLTNTPIDLTDNLSCNC